MNINIGEKISNNRKKLNMSQEELASKVGVSRQAVSKWETGESIPDIENLVEIGKTFNVSLDFLINDSLEDNDDFTHGKIDYKMKFFLYLFMITGIMIFIGFSVKNNYPLLENIYIIIYLLVSIMVLGAVVNWFREN